MKELLIAMMVWVSAHSDLKMPDHTPYVRYASYEELNQLAGLEVPEDGEMGVIALYVGPTDYWKDPANWLPWYLPDTILLSDDWSVESVSDQSTLLHEVVHFMQEWNGRFSNGPHEHGVYPCIGAAEKPAYELQALWLRTAWGLEDEELWATMQMNPLSLMLVTTCHGFH